MCHHCRHITIIIETPVVAALCTQMKFVRHAPRKHFQFCCRRRIITRTKEHCVCSNFRLHNSQRWLWCRNEMNVYREAHRTIRFTAILPIPWWNPELWSSIADNLASSLATQSHCIPPIHSIFAYMFSSCNLQPPFHIIHSTHSFPNAAFTLPTATNKK